MTSPSQDGATMQAPVITGDWELDREIMAIVETAARIIEEQAPCYEDFRTRALEDDA